LDGWFLWAGLKLSSFGCTCWLLFAVAAISEARRLLWLAAIHLGCFECWLKGLAKLWLEMAEIYLWLWLLLLLG
jgi:hypothetical protein